MKRIFAIGLALAFTLGVAGFSFAAEKKVCDFPKCCESYEKAGKKDVEGKKAVENDQQNQKKWYMYGGG